MATLKDITELPLAESAESVNLIINDNGAAKQIPANAVGVKSWNDLEDKPFGDEEEEIILEQATYDGFFNPEANFNVLEELPEMDLIIGDIVRVYWDGQYYDCQVISISNESMIAFGNMRVQSENYGGYNNDYPFMFSKNQYYDWSVVAYGDTSITSHTFGITKIKTNKIDSRVLPLGDERYDLILEYHGQIYYGCQPEAHELAIYPKENMKKVIEKVNRGISANVLFRHRRSGYLPSYCIEVPMQITAFEEAAKCYALIHFDDEGTLTRLVEIYFSQDGDYKDIRIDPLF